MTSYLVLAFVGAALCLAWRHLYPKPYPGIPHVAASAGRVGGDLAALMSAVRASDEVTGSMFAVSTRRLGAPLAQVLFPRFRPPLVVLDDPLEVQDVLVRRQREFDKSPTQVDIFAPMFPRGSLARYTTPELRAQKRLWSDVMHADFLRATAAPRIHGAALELLSLWEIKAASMYKDRPFDVLDDFKNAALDAIWAVMVGESPGVTRTEIEKLQAQLGGYQSRREEPRGAFVKEEMAYISEAISRNSKTPMPTWAQKLETWTPRHRKFRRTVVGEVSRAMEKAVGRYRHIETSKLEVGGSDTCMIDVVLRRQMVEDQKKGATSTDPTKDQSMLDEMFIMLVGGHDSTANALSWFVKFMELYPAAQTELRAALKTAFPGPQPPTHLQILDTEIPYLDAVCEESLRLAGTSKGNLRRAVVDTEILGYKIPKGAEVLLNLHINHDALPVDNSKRSASSQDAIQKHGDCFAGAAGQDLDKFQPSRWLVHDQDTGRDRFHPYAIPSIAFGGGYRGCFGRKLAIMEFRILVVLLILNFEFEALPDEFQSMKAFEKIFRHPQKPFAKIKSL